MVGEEKRLTKDFLKKLLRKDFKQYYSTPYLNDCIYLHYKGFDRIENLEEFTGLKVIYLEGNGLNTIEGTLCCVMGVRFGCTGEFEMSVLAGEPHQEDREPALLEGVGQPQLDG